MTVKRLPTGSLNAAAHQALPAIWPDPTVRYCRELCVPVREHEAPGVMPRKTVLRDCRPETDERYRTVMRRAQSQTVDMDGSYNDVP
ncbi:MAG: hypothetical protein JWO42_710 [Chloroflexi bacterium]|nr:hypothetical protein [Chloroflexota bacterium]